MFLEKLFPDKSRNRVELYMGYPPLLYSVMMTANTDPFQDEAEVSRRPDTWLGRQAMMGDCGDNTATRQSVLCNAPCKGLDMSTVGRWVHGLHVSAMISRPQWRQDRLIGMSYAVGGVRMHRLATRSIADERINSPLGILHVFELRTLDGPVSRCDVIVYARLPHVMSVCDAHSLFLDV